MTEPSLGVAVAKVQLQLEFTLTSFVGFIRSITFNQMILPVSWLLESPT